MPWARSAVVRASAAVFAIAILTHLPALWGGFVWLDHAHVEGGLAIARPSDWMHLFTRGFAGTGYYRPLTALTLSIDALLSGARPLTFHATNLVWHGVASVCVVLAARALRLGLRAALFAALLFAVHPITSLVADAIAFRSEAMVAASLLVLVWSHEKERPFFAFAAIAFGGLSKENAVVLAPLFVVALEWSHRRPLAKRSRLFVAEGLALALVLALRLAFAPSWRATSVPLGGGDAVGTRLASLAKSAAAVVLPVDRSICDAFPVTHPWQPTALAGGIALLALAWGAFHRRGPTVLLALAILPSLQLVPVMRFWSPHYLYVPLAFAAMLAGEACDRLATRAPRPTMLAVAAALALFAALSLHDARRYRSDETLWAREVERQPACREGQHYLGDVAREQRRWDDAARRYEAALARSSAILAYVDRRAALQNLGTVRIEQRRYHAARAAFQEALDGTEDEGARRELRHDLAVAALGEGDPAFAEHVLESETHRPDALPQSLLVRALALDAVGRHEEASALRRRSNP